MALQLSTENFDTEILKSNSLAVVDFFAEWCGPCKIMGPIIEKFYEKYKEKIIVAKVNVDESPDLSGKYQIMSIPTIILFKNGEVQHKEIGVISEDKLQNLINQYLL